MSSFPASSPQASCPHLFVRTRVLSRWTSCLGCQKTCWVGQGLRRCNLCDVHYHDDCFDKAVQQTSVSKAGATAVARSMPPSEPQPGADGSVIPPDGGPAQEEADLFDGTTSTVKFEHVHELYPTRVGVTLSCDGCAKPVTPLLWESLTCVDCDAVFHKECGEALPSDVATRLSHAEVVARRAAAHNATAQETALSDTLRMLAQFNAKNQNWFMTAANPMAMHRLRKAQSKMYISACLQLRDADLPDDELTLLRRALRFATAAYGQAYETGHMSSTLGGVFMRIANRHLMAPKRENNNVAVMQILQMPRDALLHARWGGSVFDPSYCVVADRAHNALVLAFRGSLSDADFLTDACGSLVPFCGGQAHKGMVAMIDKVVEDTALFDLLRRSRERHPDRPLLVTGHSLGAGLAMLFAVKVVVDGLLGTDGITIAPPESREERAARGVRRSPPEDAMACSWMRAFAFAPPPVVTLPLADRFDSIITSVVVAKDMVPRLQITSVDRLGAQLAAASAKDAPQSEAQFGDGVEECFVAGTILFSTKSTHVNTRLTRLDRASALLRDIFISSYMVSNHIMDQYGLALAAVAAARSAPPKEQEQPAGGAPAAGHVLEDTGAPSTSFDDDEDEDAFVLIGNPF